MHDSEQPSPNSGMIMRHAGEPSVEEILASIKQVIARDNRSDSGRAGTVRGDPKPDVAARDRFDVLDLHEVAAPGPEVSTAHNDADDAPLLSEATASAMHASLSALAMLAMPGAQPQIVRSGETSLEGLVREMLRPMLTEWLDKNLPAMVDKLVAAEIARIVHKKT